MWAEAPVEGWHKFIRSFKSGAGCRARQGSIEDNLRDVFTRILDISHPAMTGFLDDILCSKCGDTSHSARSCENKKDVIDDSEHNEIQNFFL